MKNSIVFASLASTAFVAAYPNMGALLAEREASFKAESNRLRSRALGTIVPFPKVGGIPRPAGSVPFDAAAQRVSVEGDHAFIAPGPTDQRGPCAGLNAAANHGYLPRNGIATYQAVETGLFEAFGLDQSATQFLQQTTSFFDGDPIAQKWSIGGADSRVDSLGGALSLLGTPSGICGYGHAKSEGDASITRGDFLAPTMNSNCASYPTFFQELLDRGCAQNADCSIDASVLAAHQNARKQYSIATNPNYFSPVFAGVAFTPAAHLFARELMANRSAEAPQGVLTPAVIKDFFSYTNDANGNLVYKYGYERIPNNWYKRAITDPWTLPDILVGVAQQCAAFPDTCAVGGNTGKVNSFAGVNVGDLTGGAYNEQAYTDPELLGCMLSQNIQAEAPSFLSNVFQGPMAQAAVNLISSTLVPTFAKGFGECNGINVKGGNGAKPLTLASLAKTYPGAAVKYNGARAKSPAGGSTGPF